MSPGQEVSCQVSVLNTGPVVDQVVVDVVGQAASWTTVEPAVLNLYPGASAEVRVRFHPPRQPDTPAGVVPFGVRAHSREDPGGSMVEEGQVEVGPFTEISAVVDPRTARGRRQGRYRLHVANLGNTSTGVAVHFVDPQDLLKFRVNRSTLVTEPGMAEEVKFSAQPRKGFWRGPEQTRQFQVMVTPDDAAPVITDAELIQQPLLARWVLPVLAALMALILALVVLWLTVLKPTIKSAATEAVNDKIAPVNAAVDNANKKADEAKQAAGKAEQQAGGGSTSPGNPGGGQGGPAGGGDPTLLQPFDMRIQASATPVANGNFTPFPYPHQSDKPIDITDIQLQNPEGDQGTIEIRRNNSVWLRFGLANFRDYDDHFVEPIHFNKGDVLYFAVNCKNPAGKKCTPALTFSGRTSD